MTGEAMELPFDTPTGGLVAHGTAARERLWAVLGDLQAADPLAPVTVAVPSPYAGLSLRRDLGRERGLLNVRFMPLARIAELLGAPALAARGRRPLTRPLRVEAVAAALADDPGPFHQVHDHPSTARGLAGTLADLRAAGIDPDRAETVLADRGPRAAAVARLYAAVSARTQEFYDEDDVLRAATEVVQAATPDDDLGHVIVWLPTSLSAAAADFVDALATARRATAIVGLTGDADVDAATARPIAHRVGLDDAEAAGTPPIGTGMIAVPDPEDEVRAVSRRILERARAGTPLHEVAVIYRLEEPYARLVPEVFDAAGIPWNGPSPRRLADAVVARVLLGALALAQSDLARDEVAAWLAGGPILDPATGHRVSAARWDVISREAGVVAGAEQWAERLGRHREQIGARLVAARTDDEITEWRIASLQRDHETVAALAAFVADLGDHLDAPSMPSWSAHVEWTRSITERYLGSEARRGDWPDAQLEAARRVDAVLDELAALDVLGAPVDLPRFRRAFVDELDVPAGRVEQFGRGVFVGPLHAAYGTRAEAIYLLGMAEGSFPPRGSEDPLLPDSERRAIDDSLPTHTERGHAERRDYLAALAAAPERILCFPRADPRAQRRRLPARWLVDTARALHGSDLTAEALRDLDAQPWLEVVQSFEQGMTEDAEPASRTELDVRALSTWAGVHPLRDHPLVVAELDAGIRAVTDRASATFSAYDGLVGPIAGLAPDATRSIAPTSLEDWATCPFRYLLGRVLRIREVAKPEATESISALDEGALVHRILERFVGEAPPRGRPDEPWEPSDRALLERIVDEECDDAEQRGITGRRLHWLLARRRIRATALRFLRTDELVRAATGTVPAPEGLEMAFGLDGQPPAALTLPDGRTVTFRGRIDRVDRSPDGAAAVVYDYKTGKPRKAADDPLEAGRKLQLPVYALAAAERLGAGAVTAHYWYTRLDGAAALTPIPIDDPPTRARFLDLVGHVVEGIGAGCFPANPGESEWSYLVKRDSFANCAVCAFDRLCAPDRGSAWDRKADDPAVEPFLALDPEEDDEDDQGTDGAASS